MTPIASKIAEDPESRPCMVPVVREEASCRPSRPSSSAFEQKAQERSPRCFPRQRGCRSRGEESRGLVLTRRRVISVSACRIDRFLSGHVTSRHPVAHSRRGSRGVPGVVWRLLRQAGAVGSVGFSGVTRVRHRSRWPSVGFPSGRWALSSLARRPAAVALRLLLVRRAARDIGVCVHLVRPACLVRTSAGLRRFLRTSLVVQAAVSAATRTSAYPPPVVVNVERTKSTSSARPRWRPPRPRPPTFRTLGLVQTKQFADTRIHRV